jgi:hypothetical protein
MDQDDVVFEDVQQHLTKGQLYQAGSASWDTDHVATNVLVDDVDELLNVELAVWRDVILLKWREGLDELGPLCGGAAAGPFRSGPMGIQGFVRLGRGRRHPI